MNANRKGKKTSKSESVNQTANELLALIYGDAINYSDLPDGYFSAYDLVKIDPSLKIYSANRRANALTVAGALNKIKVRMPNGKIMNYYGRP